MAFWEDFPFESPKDRSYVTRAEVAHYLDSFFERHLKDLPRVRFKFNHYVVDITKTKIGLQPFIWELQCRNDITAEGFICI